MEAHLKKVYGFNEFRKYQKDIINDILKGENVFAILPTGGGKSLLYQFPATFTGKITVVVSPLISLMNDQFKYLNSCGIKTICLNSETEYDVSTFNTNKVIYTTPEFITTNIESFIKIKDNIGLFAIDEAHCVSQWSHDFRKSYQQLGIIQKYFEEIPLLAVTATATPKVLDEMYTLLDIYECNEYSLGTRRTNISINVLPKSEFKSCKFNKQTIVYVQTRKLCEKLSNEFNERGITSAFYHGAMLKEEKENAHDLFINGKINVIVATISFGMGIDKSDIRHVVNYGVPSNIETYYQEIGRAGRDGLDSNATIYYNEGDFSTIEFLIAQGESEAQMQIKTDSMNIFRSFLKEKFICRQQMIDYYFQTGELAREEDVINIKKCNMCDNCSREVNVDLVDISNECNCVIDFMKQRKKERRYDMGLKKTISEIQNLFTPNKSEVWTRDVVDILINKQILKRYKSSGFGYVIGIGTQCMNGPIMARIDTTIKYNIFNKTKNKTLINLIKLRNIISEKYNLTPTTFINDRVLLNIDNKSPKTISELWRVDGISNEFIVTPQCSEFMEKYIEMNKYKRNGIKWTEQEETQLIEELKKGETIKHISTIHKRTIGGITGRLEKISIELYKKKCTIQEIQIITKLTCEKITMLINSK